MASNFIPMHSSSPPPLDDCPDNDDDEEEFGTFSSATIAFDSSFDSPDKCKPFKAGDNGVNDVTFKNDLNSFYADLPPTEKYSHGGYNSEKKLSSENDSQNRTGTEDRNLSENQPISENDIASKDGSESSRNIVPDDVSVESLELSEVTEKYQDSFKVTNASVVNCELDESSDRHFVPPLDDDDELECDEGEMHIPSDVYVLNNQSTDLFPCESQKPLSSVNSLKENVENSKTLANEACHRSTKNSDEINSSLPAPSEPSFLTDFSNTDEYDDFQSCVVDEIKIEKFDANFDCVDAQFDADFDADFADFQSCPSQPPADVSNHRNADEDNGFPEDDNEDFDDFGDFRSCEKTSCASDAKDKNGESSIMPSTMKENFHSRKTVDDTADDFDDFQGPPVEQGFAQFESDSKAESDSPEFADFEGASFSSMSSENLQHFSPVPSSMLSQEKSADKLSTVMNAIFPHEQEDSETPDISQEPSSEILEQSNKSRRLWEKLHEAEQTPGMRFQWGVSHSFQQLLRSVNVDYHSILRTSSVPIFASSLSLLEPVKGLANSVNQESEDRIQSPKDPIPPVEFDWNSSGLINPLDSGQTSSVLMDLSFLTSSESSSTPVAVEDSFENEMLKPSPALPCLDTNSKTFILEELLSKNVCTLPNSHLTPRPSDLSEEANSVLDQLPDLSFIRAKVLMFPLSNKT